VDAGANTETILASTMANEEVPEIEEDIPF
jgi:hypothetical protein